jgi:hypothetical protein
MTHNLERAEWYKEGAYALITGVLYGSTSIAGTEWSTRHEPWLLVHQRFDVSANF